MFHNRSIYFSRKTKWSAKINYFSEFIKINEFIWMPGTQKCQDTAKIDKVKQVENWQVFSWHSSYKANVRMVGPEGQ